MSLEKVETEKNREANEKKKAGKPVNGKEEAGKAMDEKVETEKAMGKESPEKEAVYTVEEFAENAKSVFGTRKECVTAALKNSGITACGVSRAKEAVEAFMKKEVR